MAKKSEINKKGRLAKSTLSVVLAASMVLTSSSFVWAAPVEDIAIVEEGETAVEAVEAPVEATADVVEDAVAGPDENVGVEIQEAVVTVEDGTYTGSAVKPKVTVVADGKTLTEGLDFEVAYDNNINAGKYAQATVNFIGAYVGATSVTKEFTINPMTLTDKEIKLDWPVKGLVYTGDKQTILPTAVTVLQGLNINIKVADIKAEAYSSSYDLKSVGEQKIKLVSDNSNFIFDQNTIGTYTYKIEQAEFNTANVTVSPASDNVSLYTGKPVAAEVVVKDGAGKVVDPKSYDIMYFDKDGKSSSTPQTDVGTGYRIQIVSNGNGNYKAGGVLESTYSIVSATLGEAAKKATIGGQKVEYDAAGTYTCKLTYTGKDQLLSASDIVIPGLTQGSDYEISSVPTSVKNVSDTATITFKGKNNYTGTVSVAITVNPMIINTKDFSITAKADKLASGATPVVGDMDIVIKKGDVTLEHKQDGSKDFKIGTIDAVNRKVQIIGTGNYTTVDDTRDSNNYIEVSYTQAYKKLIEKATVDPVVALNWTGKQITPAVVVKVGAQTLKKDVDYKVAYGENVNCGEDAGKVTITGIGDYEGTKEVTFDIVGTDISSIFKLTASNVTTDAVKAGKGKSTPVVTFTNGASVPNDFTYTTKYYKGSAELNDATFKTLTKNDTVTVKVTGTGKYSGSISGTYTVVEAKDIAESIEIGAIADQAFTGKAVEPNVVLVKKAGVTATFTKGKDYTVSYMANTEVGTAYAIVTGIGEYAGEVVKAFNIVGEMTQDITVLAAQERDLGNGSRTMNSAATYVKYSVTPKTTVTYTSSDEKVVTVDSQGNIKYTGLGEATITIKAAAERGYKEAVKTLTVKVGLAKPSFTPTKSSKVKKSFVVTSSTVKGSEGWEVQYSLKSNMKSSVTKTFADAGAKLSRKTITANKSNKIYYVRVRSYATVNGQKSYSAWSAVKPVVSK